LLFVKEKILMSSTRSSSITGYVPRIIAAAACSFGWLNCATAACIVNSALDDPNDASAKVTSVSQAAWSGSHRNVVTLRDCIVASNLMTGSKGVPTMPGMTIELAKIAGSAITLQDNLPLLFNNTTIRASAGKAVAISGNAAYRIFFVSGLPRKDSVLVPDNEQPVAVTLSNLVLEDGFAHGGDGAGGGMGAGGALFVNQNATVTLDNVTTTQNIASGGYALSLDDFPELSGGGMGSGTSESAGGGGLNGPGLYNSGAGIGTPGTSQFAGGFGGTGLGQISVNQNFSPAAFDVDIGTGTLGSLTGGGGLVASSGIGGPGGFGGGGGDPGGAAGFGGGGAFAFAVGATGGSGGFGGGGGGVFFFGTGGNGGFGAGAGTTADFPNAAGISGVAGGVPVQLNGDAAFTGGGGAGLGGAVFVRSGGSLRVESTKPSIGTNNNIALAGGYELNGSRVQTAAEAGDGLFVMTGASATFDIAATYTIGDEIADDSLLSLPAGNSYVPGNGSGANVLKTGTGTLVMDGADSRAGSMYVQSGTLAGYGLIFGPVTLGTSGRIKPGDPKVSSGIGTLSVGSLAWNSGGTMAYQLGVDNNSSDHLQVTGPLLKQGTGPFLFSFGAGAAPPVAGQTYLLISAGNTGAFSAQDFSFAHDASLQSLSGNFSVNPTGVYFSVTAVQP
jgi:hypothetical protein